MRKNKYYHYFVEGETEEKLINLLKTDMQLIVPGKVQKFNVVEKKLNRSKTMSLKMGTTIVCVFDTDTGEIKTLQENLSFLRKESNIEDVLCVTQVKNLEDELKRSCTIKQIRELTGSKTNEEFKRDMIKDSKFGMKLLNYQFDFDKFWNSSAEDKYHIIRNDAKRIKLKK